MSKHIPECKSCGVDGHYNERYDSYYCAKCWTWIEGKCKDKKCCFCTKRPSKPPMDHEE